MKSYKTRGLVRIFSLLFISLFLNKVNSQVLHVDYVQTAYSSNSFTLQLYVSKTSAEPMKLAALNTIFVYSAGQFAPGTVTFTLAPAFAMLPPFLAANCGYIVAQNKMRAMHAIYADESSAPSITSTPQLYGTMVVTSANTIVFPQTITPSSSGNPKIQGNVFHNGAFTSTAISLELGTITTDENPLILGTLPIKLGDFTAEKLGERSAKLDWTTVTETNSSHFGIERSENGSRWENIGRVQAAGFSRQERVYGYVDSKLPRITVAGKVLYYRLKMVDTDGRYQYTDMRTVIFEGKEEGYIHIYPNPAAQKLFVDLSGIDHHGEDMELSIIDMGGSLVVRKTFKATNVEPVQIDQLPANTYQILIKHGEQIYQSRLVKVD
jgi:hypothetical protein